MLDCRGWPVGLPGTSGNRSWRLAGRALCLRVAFPRIGVPTMMSRTWAWAISLCLALGAAHPAGAQTPSSSDKVLRYAFLGTETGFDPAQINDLYSAAVIAHVLDAPYEYDYLPRPAKIVPNLAEAMPEVSPDFRTFTFRLRSGIYFTDDPAFGGKPREVVA